jgi:hypothetical protein
MSEKKPFQYDELRAMGMLCAAKAVYLAMDKKCKDETKGAKAIENAVTETIDIRWNDPDKGSINDCISQFPTYDQLFITHNGHRTNYENVEEYLGRRKEDVCEEELKLMKKLDTIWEIQIYPITPVSFHWAAASTLKEAIRLILLNSKDGKWT